MIRKLGAFHLHRHTVQFSVLVAHVLCLTFHAPMIDAVLSNKSQSIYWNPLPEQNVFRHNVSLHLTFHFDVENLKRFLSWKHRRGLACRTCNTLAWIWQENKPAAEPSDPAFPFNASTLLAGFMMAESADIGLLIGLVGSFKSIITTWAVSPIFSRTQINLSDSMVRVLKLMLVGLIPTLVNCNRNIVLTNWWLNQVKSLEIGKAQACFLKLWKSNRSNQHSMVHRQKCLLGQY